MTQAELYDSKWLLAYEAYVRNWLPSVDGVDYIAADPNFSALKAANVRFYDTATTIASPTTTSPASSIVDDLYEEVDSDVSLDY